MLVLNHLPARAVRDGGDQKGRKRDDQSKEQSVERMVIPAEPEQRMGGVSREKFGDDAQTVKIGRNGGCHNQGFFPTAKSGELPIWGNRS